MLRFAKAAFLALVFSLPFMKPDIILGGLPATATDLLFLIAAAAFGLAVIQGRARLGWDALYAFLLAYFAAMLLSALFAQDPDRAWLKLATQAYLLGLPVLAASLVRTVDELRAVFYAWLAGTAVTAAIGTLTILLFALGADDGLAGFSLHEFGTLPPGNYPRLETTFRYPAMLCNYLSVSLMVLLVARHVEWVGDTTFKLLAAVIGVTALFTLTPGLGGIFLALGLWGFLLLRDKSPVSALTLFAAGAAAALAFTAAASVTPIVHPTAPFLIELPGIERELAPSVRMMTWIDAAHRWLQQPLLGAGIGVEAVSVGYVSPSGKLHHMTDAHNMFLSIAVQSGLLGVAAIIMLISAVVVRTWPLRLEPGHVLPLGLGLAWLNAFVYQGLTGSYEDARHLWLLLGLLIAAVRLGSGRSLAARPAGTSQRILTLRS